ncbi:MAG: bifunctional adenosylcobinamide kinase/adenosylcobinamide-phosphate guanylyltransferase [Acidobacteria bacterium]|nr:MAG: bifunctional adenosylcobinamide kinase/adenosylcobinamide-phosphate guanylyltransferase [Acidobacteriota bacterium]
MSPGTETPKKNVTLVLGGAQSGKSYYAQQLASHFESVTFIATGRRTDAEMRKKIAQHRRERPIAWRTIEAPLDLHKTIRSESRKADVILVDCLTVYVANVMRARKKSKRYPKEYIEAVCDAIRASKAAVVAVSNEVGSGVVPAYTSGRIYRDFLGQMNQKIAQIADTVILMVAGVPVILKDSGISQHEGDASFAGSATNRSGESTNGVRKRHSSDGLNS